MTRLRLALAFLALVALGRADRADAFDLDDPADLGDIEDIEDLSLSDLLEHPPDASAPPTATVSPPRGAR